MKLTQTLVGVVGRRSSPRPVVKEGFANVAVVALCVVFAVAHQASLAVLDTLAGVAVTLTPVRQRTFIVKMRRVFMFKQEVDSSCFSGDELFPRSNWD